MVPSSVSYETCWGNRAAIFWSLFSDKCHAPRFVTLTLSLHFPHRFFFLRKLEAKPQEAQGGLKVAPMITAGDSFVDPRLQTADQIVRIYRSLEVVLTPTADLRDLSQYPLCLETSCPQVS